METTSLGTFIKNARMAKGLSQQALSDASGVSRYQIFYIENGKVKKPYLSTLKSICKALDISFNEASEKCGYNNSSTENTSIGTTIRNARKAKGLSLQALSDASGVSCSQISLIENGKHTPRLLTLQLLCISLDIDFNEALEKCGYSKGNDNSTEDISLGTRIRNARIAKGLYQQDLGDACGLHRRSICLIEKDKVRPQKSTLSKICTALDLDFEEVSKLS